LARFKTPVNVKGNAVGIDQATSKPQDIVCSSFSYYAVRRTAAIIIYCQNYSAIVCF